MSIGGVVTRRIYMKEDDRGYLFEAIRSDDPQFMGFGQIYFVRCNPGKSRGGHYHLKHWDYFLLLYGAADLVLLDLRPGLGCGDSERMSLVADEPKGIIIPPLVWHRVDSVGGDGFFAMGMPSHAHSDGQAEDTFRMKFEDAQAKAAQHQIYDATIEDGQTDRRFQKLSARD